jgi:eukaryotic-like serine/threonine-protein kinase
MALSSGTKLGPYEIVAPLGAGGMGEVYRARDTRLDRSVAVKILPAHLADRPDAAERFEREARTISSLNHPHICQLHDVGTQNGMRYLVMELLEGETLSERLRRGPLPLEQVLRYGAEIAEGLHAAHRRGVVHRDLKPGNVMLTKSGAKLMDFGLAKEVLPHPVSEGLTATLTSSHPSPLTQQGTIVGTFQYMAPEQVEGKETDARTDIFCLGAVLYEMVSGKRAFEGKTLVSVAASILEKEPEPVRTLQPLTPASLERAIRKCLAKDPDGRWQSAGDLASELRWIAEGVSSGTHTAPQIAHARGMRVSEWLAWMFCAMAIIAVIVLSLVLGFSGGSKPLIRTQIAPSEKLQFNFVGDGGGPPVISPDGTHIVFSARAEGKSQLFVRSMDQLNPAPLPGTEDGTFPFWSPDSRSIAFFAGGKVKRMDIGGGPAVNICDGLIARGGAWSSKGIILFSPNAQQPLSKVSATGGTPTPATRLSDKYTTHRWPQFMPDGEHFIYFAANHNAPAGADTGVFWASLDGKDNKFLLHTLSNAIYAAGYLLFVRENALMAQRFNPSSGVLEGEAMVLNDDVQVDGSVWRGTFTASDNGTLIYQPGLASAAMRLTWLDRTGKEIAPVSAPDAYTEVQMSPDDKKAAVVIEDQLGIIWIYDLLHGTRTRFSFGNGAYSSPVWSHDGKRLAYIGPMSGGKGDAVMVKAADGSGEEKQLMPMESNQHAIMQQLWDWSPDGRYILYSAGTFGVGNGQDIWVLPVNGDQKPFPYAAGPGEQSYAQFSPDGRWVAYVSNETGQMELYVAPFPWTGAKWQVSTRGGWVPRWTRDGKEIVFQTAGSPETWLAEVDGHGSSFEVGSVRVLFESNNLAPNTSAAQYAVTSDGQRFLEITTGDAGRLPLTVIQNWTAELKRK